MMSDRGYLLVAGTNKLVRIPPHLMFYAPYATDKDIGSPPGAANMPHVIRPGQPDAYILSSPGPWAGWSLVPFISISGGWTSLKYATILTLSFSRVATLAGWFGETKAQGWSTRVKSLTDGSRTLVYGKTIRSFRGDSANELEEVAMGSETNV